MDVKQTSRVYVYMNDKKQYKYSVLCFIVNNYEIIREVQNPDSDVEYILVTDDKNLKSDTWNVIYDSSLCAMSQFERCHNIKYNVFKYATTDICIYIDASIQIKDSLDKLVNDFNLSNADIGLLCHPFIQTFIPELQLWIKQRGYSHINANRFVDFLSRMNYNLEYKSHFQSGISIRRKSKMTRDFENLVLSHLYYIADDEPIERIDQLMADYVMNTYFNDKKVFLLSMQCMFSKALQIYKHNSNEINTTDIHFETKFPDYAYCFNNEQECYQII